MSISTRDLLVTGLVSALLIIVTLAGLSLVPASTWDAMRPATCLPTACFCEAPLTTESIRQPVNAVSSLAYVIPGAWMLVTAGQVAVGVIFGTGHRIMMGLSAIVIGVGSAFYHGSLTFVGPVFRHPRHVSVRRPAPDLRPAAAVPLVVHDDCADQWSSTSR
ncbi:MAG: hypothetical protein IPM16_11945 [Chloroflexi bacterium]|nr:hypothetical protein [Chloroflexota bacterium]